MNLKRNIYRQIVLKTELQAVAVSITIAERAYTFCSIYIPPSSTLKRSQLNDLKSQLPSPIIFMGDFNSHNPLWGSSYTNPKGNSFSSIRISPT